MIKHFETVKSSHVVKNTEFFFIVSCGEGSFEVVETEVIVSYSRKSFPVLIYAKPHFMSTLSI